MPIKQVTCSICKQVVNKAQTYHVGGTDRACKSHQGVVEKKEVLEAAKKEKADRQKQRDEVRQDIRTNGVWSQDFSLKCWVCMNKGMHAREFFMKLLVERAKLEKIKGGPVNPFLPENQVKLGTRCIYMLSEEQAKPIMKFVREDFRMLVGLGGYIPVCFDCCHMAKIEPIKPPTWDDLVAASASYEVFMKPVVEQQAARELARDN